MIYGINFGADPIPDDIKKKFAERLDSKFRSVSADRGVHVVARRRGHDSGGPGPDDLAGDQRAPAHGTW